MNRLSRILAVFLLAAFASITASAQTDVPEPPPCIPPDGYNCSALSWVGPINLPLQVTVCGHPCNINVVYYRRDGTCGSLPPIHEFQIVQVELLDPGCPYNCPPKPTTADDYLAQATFFMLLFNPMGFPTSAQRPGCVTDWRASMSACQFIWQSRFGRKYVIKCANSTECCTAGYRVCVDGQGHINSVKSLTPQPPPAGCPPDDVTGAQTPCKPSCNALYDLIDPYYGKRVFSTETEDMATVAPNPAIGRTTITSPTMVDGGALLMLYDVRGAMVDNQRRENASGGRYSFTLDVKSLPAGAYYYTIKADNEPGFTVGSLNVSK